MDEIFSIAKRENNTKRGYLIVNPSQGKHVPCPPSSSLALFSRLADLLSGKYGGERILFVGFAETATAVGAHVAAMRGGLYIQTTREKIPGVGFLNFFEEHSHATDQKIVKDDLDGIVPKIDRIIFVEDEISTGRTILNAVGIIEKGYNKKLSFSVLSILNGMSKENLLEYETRKIDVLYLRKVESSGFEEAAESFKKSGKYFRGNCAETGLKIVECTGFLDSRRLVDAREYEKSCEILANQVSEKIDFGKSKKILVIGTEEFMYPAIFVGKRLEDSGLSVMTHSTTRSPISVFEEENYALNARHELISVYENSRTTFLYNIYTYDKVLVLTDSKMDEKGGIFSLVNALETKNVDVTVVRWS